MILLIFLIGFILVPSFAFAWGPMTHMYLANEIYSYAPLIPAGILAIIKKYKQDFLYGNLMADMILGKKFLPEDKSSHSWEVAFNLMEHAEKGPEKAFVYGYLSHLAADTVAHGILTDAMLDMEHTLMEIRADSVIDKDYWLQSVTFSKAVQRRNDRFLEGSLNSFIFSFKTNKRIYKSMVFFSFLILKKKKRRGINTNYLYSLHDESIARMLDLIKNGRDSAVIDISPL
ncbi:MAG: zinc dependent phospholipase C family protein [Dissulfurispiraceae bacterium]|jgi:hypothetical protein